MHTRVDLFAGLNETVLRDGRDQNDPIRDRLLELSLLYSISRSYNLTLQAADLLEKTEEFLRDTLYVDSFSLLLLERKSNELKAWRAGNDGRQEGGTERSWPGKAISLLVAGSGEPVLVRDTSRDKRFLADRDKGAGIGSFLSVPLRTDDGQTIGVLNIHKARAHALRDSDTYFFSALANDLAHALERSGRYECALKKSMHDSLTCLYNRRFFLECAERELNKARRNSNPISLLLLDLDFFKSVNDRYGHAFGDQVLEKMAVLLKSAVRQSDVAARYGGEEFVVLLPETDRQGALRSAEKIRSLIEQELVFALEGREVRVTVTIGTASFPEAGGSVAEMLKVADRRLYLGKHQGRNRVVGPGPAPTEERGRGKERRRHVRHRTALRVVRGPHHIHSIDISSGDQWTWCTLMDASVDGFHSLVGFEPQVGARYPCRAVNDAGPGQAELFTVQVRHVEALEGAGFLMGVQVEKNHGPTWERLYQSLIH